MRKSHLATRVSFTHLTVALLHELQVAAQQTHKQPITAGFCSPSKNNRCCRFALFFARSRSSHRVVQTHLSNHPAQLAARVDYFARICSSSSSSASSSAPQVPAVFPASCRRIPRCLKTCRQAAASFAKQVVYFISGKDASSCVSSVLVIKRTSVCVTNNCTPEERVLQKIQSSQRWIHALFLCLDLMFPHQQHSV